MSELTQDNAITLLYNACAKTQAKGNNAYSLNDAGLIYRAIVLLKKFDGYKDETELNEESAINVLVRGTVIGQEKGAFMLEEAAELFKVIKFLRPSSVDSKKAEN